jgi:hypothetical protein
MESFLIPGAAVCAEHARPSDLDQARPAGLDIYAVCGNFGRKGLIAIAP